MNYYLVYDFYTLHVEKEIFDKVLDAWKTKKPVYTIDTINARHYYIVDKFGAQRFIGRYAP